MLYAELPAKRGRQVLADLAVMVWTLAGVAVGVALHRTIERLAGPGRALADAGRELSGAASGGGDRVADLPLVGGALAAPFERVGSAGGQLVEAGQTGQDVVAWLAVWPVLLLVGLPVLTVVAVYAARRARWVREARAAAGLREQEGAVPLLALRALTSRRLTELRAVAVDPQAAYAAGDHRPLAELELRSLGLNAQGLRPPRRRDGTLSEG